MLQLRVDEAVKSVSITHKFDKDELIFLNTSDVLDGEILIDSYMKIDMLKGQAKKTIQNGDILFSEIRPKNKRFAYVDVKNPDDYVVSTKLMVLRNINPNILQRYFYYYVTSDSMLSYLQMRAESRIGSFPQITFDLMSSLKLKLPSINEQKEIITKLDALDSGIKYNKKLLSNLEEYSKLLFHKWFVDFNFPDELGNPYKDSGGKMVEIDGKSIPKGWSYSPISNFSKTVTCGKTPSTLELDNFGNDIPFITIPDMHGKNYVSKTSRYLSVKGANSQKNKYLPVGSICVSCIASPGIVIRNAKISQTNQQINSIIPLKEIYGHYLFLALKRFSGNIKKISGGSIAKNLNTSQFSKIKLIKPSEDVIKEFNCGVDSLFKKIESLEVENDLLIETRDLLIKKLIK